MKTKDFIKFLNRQHCFLTPEGSSHAIFQNQKNKKTEPVARHKGADNLRKIRRYLEISFPENFQ